MSQDIHMLQFSDGEERDSVPSAPTQAAAPPASVPTLEEVVADTFATIKRRACIQREDEQVLKEILLAAFVRQRMKG